MLTYVVESLQYNSIVVALSKKCMRFIKCLTTRLLLLCVALAVAFKNAKAYDDAIASYMKQADVQKQTGSYAFY